MKRRLLAALAAGLALPALGWAQSDGFTIPSAPVYPGVRPTQPISATPQTTPANGRAASPYHVTPLYPRVEPPPLRYPSQEIPQPLNGRLVPSQYAHPLTGRSTVPLGLPVPSTTTSYKNPLDMPQEGRPALSLPEGVPGPIPSDVPRMPPVINPPSNPPINQPGMVTPGTAPRTLPTPSPAAVSPPPSNKAPATTIEVVPIPVPAQTPMPSPTQNATPRTGGSGPQGNSPMPANPARTPQTLPSAGMNPAPSSPPAATVPPQTVPSHTVPTPAPVSYPGTQAESIISTPTQACMTGCITAAPTGCGPEGRAWVGAEYLYWRAKAANAPPLISTSPVGTPIANAGVLGTPGARTIFGGDLNDQWRSGLRVRAGYWFNDARTFGLDVGGFFLGQDSTNARVSSPGIPILSRPFANVRTGMNAAQLVAFAPAGELVAFPGILAGSVSVASENEVYGFDPNLRWNLCCDCDSRIDLLIGYRYLRMRDGISIREELIATDPAGVRAPFGTQITVIDTFNSTNTFNGATVGLAGERRFGNFFLGGRVSVSGGNTQQQVSIFGTTQIRTPQGARSNLVGGLLAQRTNIGTFTTDQFSVVPEMGLNLGYQVSQNVRIFGGYNVLYWTNVARAAEQIDLGVNPTGIPRDVPPSMLQGPARPAFLNRDTDFWLHGVSAGVELRF